MPTDLELLLSSTSHSLFPYTSFNTISYSNSHYDRRLSFSQNHCMPRSPVIHNAEGDFPRGTSYNLNNEIVTRPELYNVRKKKVSFADDRGLKLVEIREIPGAPKWADDVLTLLIGSKKRTVVKEKKWKIAFEHPPWTGDKLADALDKNMVALEYISVKEATDDFLIGTVKVKNLSFEKDVFLRVTFDRWLTYVDVPCAYIKPNKEREIENAHDTFYFSSKILPVASRYEVVEFCVCVKFNDNEYWDNNSGVNYRLVVEYVKPNTSDFQQTHSSSANGVSLSDANTDIEELLMYNRMI